MKVAAKPLRKAAKSYAKRQHMVSLGRVNAQDAHQPIKGFMWLPDAVDHEFSTGHIQGFDVAMTVRSALLPGRQQPIERLIMEFHTPFSFPHIIALGSAHEEETLRVLLAGYHQYHRTDTGAWRVFTHIQSVPHIALLQDLLSALYEQGASDVEVEEGRMRLYFESLPETDGKIDAIVTFVKDLIAENTA